MVDKRNARQPITIKVRIIVTFGERQKAMIGMGYVEGHLRRVGKALFFDLDGRRKGVDLMMIHQTLYLFFSGFCFFFFYIIKCFLKTDMQTNL